LYNTSNLAIKEIQEVPVQSDSQVTVGTDNIVKLDLSRFDSRDMVQEAIRMEEAEKPVKEKPIQKTKLSLSSVAYCIAFAVLALGLLIYNLNLTVLTDQVATKKDELTELQSKESLLRTEYEKRLDLRSIEAYAVDKLGMVKTERGQVEYLEIKAPETIARIVPEEQHNLSYYFANLVKSFNAVLKNLD